MAEKEMTTAEFFSLPAIRAHLKGDAERAAAAAREAGEMEEAGERDPLTPEQAEAVWHRMEDDRQDDAEGRADEREEMARDTDEADERANELHDELRAEEQFRMDLEIRQAEADYLNPRN